jgi:hypothetical protein
MTLAAGATPDFPPLDQARVNAAACELGHATCLPVRRLSITEITARAAAVVGKPLSASTGWRLLAADTMKPWRSQYWLLPRHPHVAEKAGRGLALSAGYWQGEPLGAQDHRSRADEKTSSQARLRCHPSSPPAPGRARRVDHEDQRGGAWPYVAAWDVRRGGVMGRWEPSPGLEPCGRVLAPVMARAP